MPNTVEMPSPSEMDVKLKATPCGWIASRRGAITNPLSAPSEMLRVWSRVTAGCGTGDRMMMMGHVADLPPVVTAVTLYLYWDWTFRTARLPGPTVTLPHRSIWKALRVSLALK